MEDMDLFSVPRYKPRRLNSLASCSKFSREEIRQMYQGFKSVSLNPIIILLMQQPHLIQWPQWVTMEKMVEKGGKKLDLNLIWGIEIESF